MYINQMIEGKLPRSGFVHSKSICINLTKTDSWTSGKQAQVLSGFKFLGFLPIISIYHQFDKISFRLRKDNHRKAYSHNGNRKIKQRYWYEELLVSRSTLWLGLGIAIDLAGLGNCNRLCCHDNCWHLFFPTKRKKGVNYLVACRIHYNALIDMLDKRRATPLALGKRWGCIIIWMVTSYLQYCQSWGILNKSIVWKLECWPPYMVFVSILRGMD